MEHSWLAEVGIQLPRSALTELIDYEHAAVICDVEPIRNEFKRHLLGDLIGIIAVQIYAGVEGRSSKLAAASNRNLTCV